MTFFAPILWKAKAFYSQQVLMDKNISLDFYPLRTGPYRLVENNAHKQIVLLKNPNFHGEWYPFERTRIFKIGLSEGRGKTDAVY
ncbi:hypothetical protein [Coxiella endosymbiont of Ornithodoros maritimus]|uniref:hypothetical protein n=1 Tax=Coxiella endosymbiont of Ornithodoros maritimus TaxID=1656172 RepID=UPI002263C5DB|nr:hypothetical protein [Coxiella endosymbiont of Ornithodoros maritimus]